MKTTSEFQKLWLWWWGERQLSQPQLDRASIMMYKVGTNFEPMSKINVIIT